MLVFLPLDIKRSAGIDCGGLLTRTSCTVPQKQVAVASSSVDHPSRARPATGKLFWAVDIVMSGIEACCLQLNFVDYSMVIELK